MGLKFLEVRIRMGLQLPSLIIIDRSIDLERPGVPGLFLLQLEVEHLGEARLQSDPVLVHERLTAIHTTTITRTTRIVIISVTTATAVRTRKK